MTQIKISDDQNTVEVDGEKYVADFDIGLCCEDCSFENDIICSYIRCTQREREDKRNVIFKLQK